LLGRRGGSRHCFKKPKGHVYNLLRMETGIKRVARMSEYHHTLSHCLLKHRENSPTKPNSKWNW
jgi:hypothetical protein